MSERIDEPTKQYTRKKTRRTDLLARVQVRRAFVELDDHADRALHRGPRDPALCLVFRVAARARAARERGRDRRRRNAHAHPDAQIAVNQRRPKLARVDEVRAVNMRRVGDVHVCVLHRETHQVESFAVAIRGVAQLGEYVLETPGVRALAPVRFLEVGEPLRDEIALVLLKDAALRTHTPRRSAADLVVLAVVERAAELDARARLRIVRSGAALLCRRRAAPRRGALLLAARRAPRASASRSAQASSVDWAGASTTA